MTDSIEQLGNDAVKPATGNIMTDVDYIDEWSRMTPRQRKLCQFLFTVGRVITLGGVTASEAHALCLSCEGTGFESDEWDGLNLPFKIGSTEQPWTLLEAEELSKLDHADKLKARLDISLTK
ncbi:MAG: hypothetical protein JKY52_08515 [Flavobacteriales bacterium]|nr:hypothetical protein [Flavobacteriales bacterium]